MDAFYPLLSIMVYDILDQLGVSEKIRKLCQYTGITREIISTVAAQIIGSPCKVYIFGSSCEGTTTIPFDNDIDSICCNEQYSLIDDIRAAPRGLSYLIVRDGHTHPGYVKLNLVCNGTPLTVYNTYIPDKHDADNEGRICKKHYTTIDPNDHELERHGPADAQLAFEGVLACDFVYALRCKTIPICSQTWLHRRRRYNWPSRVNLLDMGKMGCFVVGVGHSLSNEQHIEWRLSFSLQERLLMFGLNPTQHKCYVLLKVIKKCFIKEEIGECLSSYHCKTCLFYAIEVTSPLLWRPDNLVSCVKLCLMVLLSWVINGVCPNYFVPSENMFEKPQFHAKRYRLLELLRFLISREYYHFIINGFANIDSNITDRRVYREYVNFCNSTCRCNYQMYELANNTPLNFQTVLTLSQHIERLTNTCVIGEHTEQQSRDAISYIIPVLHIHLAQRLASLACKCQSQEQARQLLYLSIHHFQHGNHANLMTSRLLVVSLLLRFEKYDLCEIMLEDIEHDFNRYVVTSCGCYLKNFRMNDHLLQHIITNNVSCKTAFRTVYVGCVRFARCDREIAPLPLQYEMYRSLGTPPGSRHDPDDNWFDWASVDGKVYFYFLQYLVFSRLNKPANKQFAIDNLVWVLGDDPNLHHTETAYNLLGWIHVQEGRILEALWCFRTSWRIRPDHNAAKFHALQLAQDIMHI